MGPAVQPRSPCEAPHKAPVSTRSGAAWASSPYTAAPHHHVAPPHHHSTHHHAALPSPPQEPFVKLLSLFEGEAAKNNNKMIMDAVSKMPGSYSDPNPNPYPTETQTVALTLTQP